MINYFDPATNRSYRDRFLKYRRKFIICPEQWETLDGLYDTYNWSELKFSTTNKDSLNEVEGIYFFLASPKKVNAPFLNYFFYVGETDNLKRRFGNYLDKIDSPKSGQYKMYTVIDDFPNHLYFYYVELPGFDQTQRREIEDNLLIAFTPPINSKYPQGLQSIILAAYGQ